MDYEKIVGRIIHDRPLGTGAERMTERRSTVARG
jgi:hypothetical protein